MWKATPMPDGNHGHDLASLASLRIRLWDAGFRPLALHSSDKRPFGDAWQDRARRDPPEAATMLPSIGALNTGILCDGLRALDIDCDDSDLAQRIEDEATARFGLAPVRWRGNSGRRLLVYRATEGEPPKRVLAGTEGRKLEVLGRGQQFHAYGTHPSGAALHWRPEPLDELRRDILPAITEAQVEALFTVVAPWIGAEVLKPERAGPSLLPRVATSEGGTPYGLRAMADECAAVASAAPGAQEVTLNAAGLKLGALVAGGELARDVATRNLIAAGNQMTTGAGERPWAPDEVRRKVERALADGSTSPRQAPALSQREASTAEGNTPSPWPAPALDLATADALPPPELPLNTFPGRWQRWIARAAERAGAPPDYVACSLLPVIGAAIGNARWVSPWEGWEHPPVVNMACIGLPSAGKSPAVDAATGPLSQLEADLNDDFLDRQREGRTKSQEAKEYRARWESDVKEAVKGGRAAPLEPLGAVEPEQPQRRRAYSTTPTMEAARDLSAANPRGLLLHRDELAGWITGMDAYSGKAGAERAFWLQAYEGKRWAADRAKDGGNSPDVPRLTWAIVGGIQPDRLASLLLKGDDDGLSARFLYCWPAARPDISEPPDGKPLPFVLKDRLLRLRQLPMVNEEPLVIPFAAEAVAAIQDARREVKRLEGEAAGLFLSWLGKVPGMAVRLSVVFLYLDWLEQPLGAPEPEAVDLDAISRALGFMFDYALPMARRAFGEAALPEAERDARRLARWLMQRAPVPETLNARMLRRMGDGPGIGTPERIEAALHELGELHLVRPAPSRDGGGKGRQRADWTVNPALRRAPA